MALLVPAILAKSPKEFSDKLEKVAPFCRKVQVDIMDGQFVPNKTIQVQEIPAFNDPIRLELHLMTQNPLSILQYPKHPAVSTVIFHYEAVNNPAEIIKILPPKLIKGIAINPETPTEALEPLIKEVDLVLLMSVSPGFDGQTFIPDTLQKIANIKSMRPGIIIEVDGGINADNAADVANIGADQAVVGSALYEANNIKRTVREIMLNLGDIEGVSL